MNNNAANFQDTFEPTIPRSAWYLSLIPLFIWIIIYQNDWNIPLFLFLNHELQWMPDIFWTTMSLFGNGWSLFAVLIPVVFFAPRCIYAALITGLIAGIVSNLSKSYFDMARPAGVLDPASFHIIDAPLLHSAMPSGHTLTAFAILTSIIYSSLLMTQRRLLPLWILAIATGLSRIAVGAHWPTDVLIGACFGILCGLTGASVARKISEKYNQTFSLPIRIIVFFSMVDAYILLTDTLDFQLNKPTQYILAIGLVIHFLLYWNAFWHHKKFH